MNRFLSKNNNQNKNKNNQNKNIEKMDFPELIVSKNNQITENETTYKNMINKEIIVKKESIPEGCIILKENVIKNPVIKDKMDIQNDLSFYNIISTQEYLDKVHDKYRETFIDLHGEDLYDKYYSMTDSHIYIEKEEEEEKEELDEDDDYE